MAEIQPEDAIRRAREALGLPGSVSGKALRVERLDRPLDAYYLVLFSGRGNGHIAVIDANSGTLDQHASITEIERHLTVSKEQAIDAAKLGERSSARLVWLPSRASRSPFYPIWEISSGGERRYVDQQAQLWDKLPPVGRGGGS
jgi:hypothetical protein